MKTLFAALILSTLTSPVLALTLTTDAVTGVSTEEFGRRSGRCARHDVFVVPGQVVAREGSTCGGV